MTVDLSDLIGNDDQVPRRRGRPTKAEAEARLRQSLEEELPHYTEFRRPVGVMFIANVVGKQPKQLQKRLEKCPVARWV